MIAVRVLFAKLEKDKQLIVLRHLIVYVLKTYACVQMVLELPEQCVPKMVKTSVLPALVDFTRLVILALNVELRVLPEQ